MNLLHFYDFETTGFPLWKKPTSDPGQPHIVQVASVLVDADTRNVVSSVEHIAKPEGWEIPDKVAEIHGITTEYAIKVGVPETILMANVFMHFTMAAFRIGHNEPFDARIMRIALKRFGDEETSEAWKAGKAECTQKMATPIVKAPPTQKMLDAGRKGNKTANLGEAYEHFFGERFEDAHTAMADVNATIAVYFAIIDQATIEVPPLDATIEVEEGPEGEGVGFL
jgi:DNA polymerase-3 subunit epsilon